LAYVASLEERLRAYEQNGVQANIHIQKLAKKLDSENRKLKRVIFELSGIGDVEIDRAVDVESLVEEIRARIGGNVHSPRSTNGMTGPPSRSSSFSGGVVDTAWGYGPSTPFSVGGYPSAPISDVRSQKPPTPPPSKDEQHKNEDNPAHNLLLTLAPNITPNCAEGFGPQGKRFCSLLRLLASESDGARSSSASIPCRVSYELLKNLIDEQDALAVENAAFELKEGIRLMDNGGCNVDAKILSKVLSRLTDPTQKDNNRVSVMANA
jgi:hypothetical protein